MVGRTADFGRPVRRRFDTRAGRPRVGRLARTVQSRRTASRCNTQQCGCRKRHPDPSTWTFVGVYRSDEKPEKPPRANVTVHSGQWNRRPSPSSLLYLIIGFRTHLAGGEALVGSGESRLLDLAVPVRDVVSNVAMSRIGPVPSDKLTVPAHKRCRRHEEGRPALTRQQL